MEHSLKVKGLLLDMDGLLLDSERIAEASWRQAEKESGYFMPEGFYHTVIGQSMRIIKDRLKEVMDPACDTDIFLEIANRSYHQAIAEGPVPVKKGARELLQLLSREKIPTCLATSTFRELAGRKLEAVDLAKHLPLRVCGDDVENSKPQPDIYLAAAARLSFSPGSLLAVEDSENGILSALTAGCQVAHVPDICRISIDVQQRVHRIFRDLEELTDAIRRGELVIET